MPEAWGSSVPGKQRLPQQSESKQPGLRSEGLRVGAEVGGLVLCFEVHAVPCQTAEQLLQAPEGQQPALYYSHSIWFATNSATPQGPPAGQGAAAAGAAGAVAAPGVTIDWPVQPAVPAGHAPGPPNQRHPGSGQPPLLRCLPLSCCSKLHLTWLPRLLWLHYSAAVEASAEHMHC